MEDEKRVFRSVWLLLCGFCVAAVAVLVLCMTHRMALPDNVGRPLSGQEAAQVAGRNSPLIDYIYLSPNGDFPRDNAIQKITIHHMAGDRALEGLGADFARKTGGLLPIMPLTARAGWPFTWRNATGRGLPAAGKMTGRR